MDGLALTLEFQRDVTINRALRHKDWRTWLDCGPRDDDQTGTTTDR